MGVYTKRCVSGKKVFVGVDLHKQQWHVTMRTEEQEVFSGSIPSRWEALEKLLNWCKEAQSVEVVYEAGCFGFWLHDRIVEYGAQCVVTPPSLLPQEYGNRVKTDRRDSAKLAQMLSKGMLKRVWVLTKEQCYHRQVGRRRRQLVRERVKVQNRIRAELRFFGIDIGEPRGAWSQQYVENLQRLRFPDRWMQESFERLFGEYTYLDGEVKKQTRLLRELSRTEQYEQRVKLLMSVPGIGLISAMEILLEVVDIARFRTGDKLAAYIGLTPSQYSSGEKVRMGHITRVGKGGLRGVLVEAAWIAIRADGALKEKFDRIRARAGAKRAIVAIARRLLLRIRRMLLDNTHYALGVVAQHY
jgi:transposase